MFLTIYLEELEIHSDEKVHMNVYSTFICDCQNSEPSNMACSRLMDK